MIKRTVSPTPAAAVSAWPRLDADVEVEISAEQPAHPIEAALTEGDERGWKAAAPGPQTIRLVFPNPRRLQRVRVVIEEREQPRTQELVLRARSADGQWRELVRQQFNFSPGGATREQEEYRADVPSAAALELTIIPDLSGGSALASLQELRIA